ncbi:MAG: hypothetical protein ACXVRH_03020 [Thermoleophilaceae bacterium]
MSQPKTLWRTGRRGRRRRAERRTQVLGALALTTTAAAIAGEFGRVWRRGSAPLPQDADDVLLAAEEAAVETVQVAMAGYSEGSPYQRALFNLFASFLISFGSARGIAHLLRRGRPVGPFRNVRLGRRHIHHFVPGITLAFASGTAAFLMPSDAARERLALGFGAGMGMTLDESALLLQLEDVYWTEEGVLSLQITLTVIALLGALAVALRLVRQGERIVLTEEPTPQTPDPRPA